MNLHAIVSGAIGSVNPPIEITVLRSTGYTTNPDATRTPTYAPAIAIYAQVQELTSADLRHVEGLNLQGEHRAVYMNGAASGIVRFSGKGGDLMQFYGRTWLVTAIPERWTGWTKAIVTAQVQGPS